MASAAKSRYASLGNGPSPGGIRFQVIAVNCAFPVLLLVIAGGKSIAGPVDLVVDPARSHAETELCLTVLSTACDTDVSPLAGTITVSVDCPQAPGEVTMRDFSLQMVDEIGFMLDFDSLGQFNATGQGITLNYADPANPLPPMPLTDDTFVYHGVPALAEGQLDYEATEALCFAFQLAGYECVDAIDLRTIVLDPLSVGGLIAVAESEIGVVIEMFINGPIDPANPDLGSMMISVRIVALEVLPPPCCPGDLTGDDIVSLRDGARLIDCLTGALGGADGPCQCADLDDDLDVDLHDFAEFQARLDQP